MKKEFIEPIAEIKVLSSEADVIRTSGEALVTLNQGYVAGTDFWDVSQSYGWFK